MEVVPDDLPCVTEALSRWVGKTDLLVLSGGLGPTHDDKTRYALAEFLDCGFALDDALYDQVVARYRDSPRAALLERSRSIQALIPTAAQSLYNPAGSALGIFFEKNGTKVFSFPGVPFEYKAMVRQELSPLLEAELEHKRTWKSVSIIGIPESLVVERIPEIIKDARLHISVLPSFGLVELVIRGEMELVDAAARTTRERFADEALPEGCATLPEAILKTGREKKLTLSCAESCTGGMVGASLTEIAGSSDVFMGSAVTYSNEAKKKLLGVEQRVFDEYGAVSAPCAEAMARGALELYGTSLSVAVTGIAGPDGGSKEKPVGTVWFAVGSQVEGQMEVRSFVQHLGAERDLVRERAVRAALDAAWRRMIEM